MFGNAALEELGFYVYALVDPVFDRNKPERIFYVGKGTGQRCFEHALAAENVVNVDGANLKLNYIRQLINDNRRPIIEIIAHGLSEPEAFRLEAIIIAAGGFLTNAIRGHRHTDYWVAATDLNARYDQPMQLTDIRANILLVSLNGGRGLPPYPAIVHEDLSIRTLGDWRLARKRALLVKYVVGVYKTLVRVVFDVVPNNNGEHFEIIEPIHKGMTRRVRFYGLRNFTMEEEWNLRRIVDDQGNTLTKFRRQQGCQFVANIDLAIDE